MSTHSTIALLASLGLLSTLAQAQVDTSAWTCETCPYPKALSGSVEAGAALQSQDSSKFGDATGLNRKGARLLLDGKLSLRNGQGGYANFSASDLGLSSRALRLQGGQEGLVAVDLGYSEIPHPLSEGVQSPYLGSGGSVLTLPAGYPASGTSTMPLATTLQSVSLGFDRKRLDASARWLSVADWTWKLAVRRDTRQGTQPGAASFYSTAVQLAVPVDQVTNQLELSTAYTGRDLQAGLSYQLSQFQNHNPSLTWSNPNFPVVAGATRGQLALAPDNQMHQVAATAAYRVDNILRVSGDVALGRSTQDAGYLAASLTPGLASTARPAASLDGRVDTLNAALRLSLAPPIEGLRVNASWMHDVRDNRTAVRSYPQVMTDIYLDTQARRNTPFSLTQDRLKLTADYRGPDSLKLSAGLEGDQRIRSYTEVVTTQEGSLWTRVSAQPREDLTLAVKLAHTERRPSGYGVATWFGAPENPLLRKYNLAARDRDSAELRGDWTPSETVALGLSLGASEDRYSQSVVGLKGGRNFDIAADASWALSERTRLTGFTQLQRMRSRQAGSQGGQAADWTALNVDRFQVFGLGLRHAVLPERLDVGADLSFGRAHSAARVDTGASGPGLPNARNAMDSVRLFASYKLQERLWINASAWYERYAAQDWHNDGIAPATVQSLLAFGQQVPGYELGVLRVSLRYGF